MITMLTDLPADVLGAEASGRVTGEDYRTVLVPAVEAYLRDHDRVRALLVLGPDFEEFVGDALWQDAQLGLANIKAWERVAVVTDHAHLRSLVGAFAFMIPGQVQTFPYHQLAEAEAWVAG